MGTLSTPAPPHEDTRARVLQTALELFAERGFAATSTRELSERLGFTKAALYYYFRTKDDLLAALIQPGLEQLTTLITQTPVRASAAARREVLAAYIDLNISHVDLLRVLTQDPSVALRPASVTHAALEGQMLQLLAGHEAPDLTEQIRARAALGAIRGALVHADPGGDPAIVRAAILAAACGALGIPAPRARDRDRPNSDRTDPVAQSIEGIGKLKET
jgi:AcrR family transcriptional regulator